MAKKVDPVLGSVLVRVPYEAESKVAIPVQVLTGEVIPRRLILIGSGWNGMEGA